MLLTYGQIFTGRCATEYSSTRISEAATNSRSNGVKQHAASSIANNPLTNPLAGIPGGTSLVSGLAKAAGDWGESMFGRSDPDTQFAKDCHATRTPPSLSKVFAALFCTIADALACLFVLAFILTFPGSQAAIAWEAMIGRCALAAGVLPEPGRSWLWGRATSIGRALAMMVTSIAVLAITVVVLDAITSAAPGLLCRRRPHRP